ncbi:MAG: aspartate--tRNA ligase [Bdellovibrionales bacterium GWB1_55_8]|nr:MAG: aspartate--tRNA ligase [Bdellovibrionales bacterium GWB1_55_8]
MAHQRTVRSHNCGELRRSDIGKEITLCGWIGKRRDHGGLVFSDLRDRYGLTQIVFDPAIARPEVFEAAGRLRTEFVIWCKGSVRSRPEGMANPKLSTGEIEVACTELQILSEAKTTPFPIEDDVEVAETVRLKYRYLDLRRPSLQRNLLVRHKMLSIVRNELDKQGFVEVETPILYKSTPEGARDFIVPSRLNPGTFYALPQSPQTLKQLLMVSGMDRYYQVARCFRDEDLRADRQPEFSQIDIEASFLDEEAFFPILETMISKLWKDVLGQEVKTPFLRMPYSEAMARFGSDKPDIRFGLELQDLSGVFHASGFQVFKNALTANSRGIAGSVRAIVVAGQAERFSRKDLDDLQAHAGTFGAKGLLWIKVQADGTLQSPAAKFFSEEEKSALVAKLGLKAGDLVLCVADPRNKVVFDALGAIRLNVGGKLGMIPKQGEGKPAFLWVVDFPLLEYDEKENRYYACHHPFTSPKPEHFSDFVNGQNLESVLASAYDMVLNGVEVGGGSMRIYRPEVQAAMFRSLGLSPEQAREKFGFFLEALQYGTPPHGGIAFGIERLTAILCGVGPIRDVMAFPKTQKGTCLMSESPSAVEPDQLRDLGICLVSGSDKIPGNSPQNSKD